MEISVGELKSCTGKLKHKSKRDADRQAKRDFLTSYRCVYCGFWHVGHKVKASFVEKIRKTGRAEKNARKKGKRLPI